MPRRPSAVLVPLAIALLSACSDGDDPGGVNTGGNFTATIDGVPWQTEEVYFTVTTGGASLPGSLVLNGVSDAGGSGQRSVMLILGFIEGPGTYPLGVNNATTPGGTGGNLFGSGTSTTQYLTPFSGNAGSVTLTTVSGGRLVGTFAYTAAPIVGSAPSVVVTNGAFDTGLPSNFVPVAGNERGSSMTATINGSAWVSATNVAVGAPGAYALGGSNTLYSVNIATVGSTTGSLTVGTQVTVTVSEIGSTNAWGAAGSTGTVTITGGGTDRSIGTFSATLQPQGSTTGVVTITNGTFDFILP